MAAGYVGLSPQTGSDIANGDELAAVNYCRNGGHTRKNSHGSSGKIKQRSQSGVTPGLASLCRKGGVSVENNQGELNWGANVMSQLVEQAKELAGKNYKDGYNCAEAIFRAFCDLLHFDLGDDAVRIAAGFGGGIGHAGCICGALSGATMVLSMLVGRKDNKEAKGPAYATTQQFHQMFTSEFGASCCAVLNPYEFQTPEQGRNCLRITGRTAELLMKYIEDRQLVKRRQ